LQKPLAHCWLLLHASPLRRLKGVALAVAVLVGVAVGVPVGVGLGTDTQVLVLKSQMRPSSQGRGKQMSPAVGSHPQHGSPNAPHVLAFARPPVSKSTTSNVKAIRIMEASLLQKAAGIKDSGRQKRSRLEAAPDGLTLQAGIGAVPTKGPRP
jgi:hypothetical protein